MRLGQDFSTKHIPVIEIALVWVISLVLAATLWFQVLEAGNRLKEATLHQASLRAHQVNIAIGNQVTTLFEVVDRALLELKQIYASNQFDQFQTAVRLTEARLPVGSLVQVAIADASGDVVYSNLGLKKKVTIFDRAHFKAHLGEHQDQLYVSKPVLGRVSKRWSIQFTRPILQDGDFIGVMVLSISPSYLQQALTKITLDSDDAVAILRESGEYLARNRFQEQALGSSADPHSPFIGPEAAMIGTFTAPAYFDKLTRLYSWMRLADYPVTIVLGLSNEAVLKPIEESNREDRWQAIGIITLLTAFSFGFSLMASSLAKQREIIQRSKQLMLAARVFQHSYEGFIITDDNNEIVEVNQGFTDITGYSREEAIGNNPSILSSGRQPKSFYEDLWHSLVTEGFWRGEIWNRRKDGEIYAELLSISEVRNDEGKVSNYIGVFSDINKIKRREAELELRADHDPLTGIPSRRLALDRLRQLIAIFSRTNQPLAVCYLDLDRFKPINDQHGHQVGDQVLIETTQRIKSNLRTGDTVARMGGDEFVLILGNYHSANDLEHAVQRVLDAIAMPIQIEDIQVSVTASIGVTSVPPDEHNAELLIRHADQAMYIAKDSGKNRFHVFTPEI
jgi:diguanylate cyclase (GGDEF)-like protein/PAS domain S-box-containing protein